MSGQGRRSERDVRRRSLGQNFLADRSLISRFVAGLDLATGGLVVDVGAGAGALTVPLAMAGVEVWAVERDDAWVERLRAAIGRAGVVDSVRVIRGDLRTVRLPRSPYRVVANPPFGLTTALLGRLLDDPDRGPERADVVVQREVARKHAADVPTSLRTAAWAPWWEFSLGMHIDRRAFRPIPSVDASVLRIDRRNPPILPTRLAPGFVEVLRPRWGPGGDSSHEAKVPNRPQAP